MSSEAPRSPHFTLSVPSSRSSSPTPSETSQSSAKSHIYITEADGFLKPTKELKPPGRRPMDVYDISLPWWRAALRRKLVATVKWESNIIARMQDAIRTPWLDAYFVYTSSLGTHTCFMIVLPAFFFFGYEEMGHGLLMVLGFGVYFSSFIKDLFCAPRPFAPPVTRLTIGSHHLEYGFPSTHSTNSVSIALFLFGNVYLRAKGEDPSLSPQVYTLLTILLGWYTFSIVYGRVYTAMHSFTDCIMGVCLGAGIWWALSDFPGFRWTVPFTLPQSATPLFSTFPSAVGNATTETTILLFPSLSLTSQLHRWVQTSSLIVPAILVPICLLLVNQHPVPVDDCPCFEDAIAFGSVVLGALLGQWGDHYWSLSKNTVGTVMPGAGWEYSPLINTWTSYERGWSHITLWWSVASLKMAFGILVIFAWRIFAKSTLHIILPPIYRFLSRAVELPHRRFYTPATDYKSVPSEFANANGLKTIPSVIDLPSTAGVGVEVGGIGSGMRSLRSETETTIRSRNGSSHLRNECSTDDYGDEEVNLDDEKEVKHYDADVLTKVVVYAGIAILVTKALPILFDTVGLGVNSWPPV